MANRECEDCGDSFGTLSKLRLHDCPEEGSLIDDALLPEPQPDKLPNKVFGEDEFRELTQNSRIDRVEKMLDLPLPGEAEAISLVYETDGHAYGLHCDPDTHEWTLTVDRSNFERVKKQHSEWLSDEIGEATGDSPDPEKLDRAAPETITKDCDMCGGSHELTAQPNSFPSALGMLEYEGFCEETGHPIIITKDLNEFL